MPATGIDAEPAGAKRPAGAPLYLYAVTAADAPPPERPGIDDHPLEVVTLGELAALVSTVTAEEPELGREALERHSQVVTAAFESGTVLPMRFGVLMADADAVRRDLLGRHHEALREQLAAMEGKVELRLRAIYAEEALMSEVVRSFPEISSLHQSVKGLDEHATYYERIRLGQMIAGAVEEIRQRDGERILGSLEPLADEVSLGELSHERIALSASFLVGREAMPRFDQAVDEIGREHDGRLTLKYVGPLPPHSFVDLQGRG